MIIEYKGIADRYAGTGVVHEVRAWWNAIQDDEGAVKRAASKAVRDVVGKGGSVTFDSWDMSTYSSPQLNAMVRVRVLTSEQMAARKELRERRYTECGGCKRDHPGQVVRRENGSEQAVCYACWGEIKGTGEACQVLHWIKADGRVQIN
ncbi:hypothetical protein ABT282_07390 [Streptomyces sp. NPDC000927]|uniref:hypothetical protein n=1 Tax=Streptomyces sp. NPDC000927 TaxID=3154371 RepID=UPI0033307B0C